MEKYSQSYLQLVLQGFIILKLILHCILQKQKVYYPEGEL